MKSMKIAFVLLSYETDAAAGMERSVAALLEGLTNLGHKVFILGAGPNRRGDPPNVVRLRSVILPKPATIEDVFKALEHRDQVKQEAEAWVKDSEVDLICWVDALWGLGFLGIGSGLCRTVLSVHVISQASDSECLSSALNHLPDHVVAPSSIVLEQARQRGIDSSDWSVVPNALLDFHREVPKSKPLLWLQQNAPIRVVARASAEKGILPLIRNIPADFERQIEIVLAESVFELQNTQRIRQNCLDAAAKIPSLKILPNISWEDVPPFLSDASVVIIPSLAETFGLVALEAMSVGTPVVAFGIDNLPDLIRDGGILVPAGDFSLLWSSAIDLLKAPSKQYAAISQKGLERATEFRSTRVAGEWLDSVLKGGG